MNYFLNAFQFYDNFLNYFLRAYDEFKNKSEYQYKQSNIEIETVILGKIIDRKNKEIKIYMYHGTVHNHINYLSVTIERKISRITRISNFQNVKLKLDILVARKLDGHTVQTKT